MKKLIMMMALAVGLTGFAAQNDKLISFYTNGPDTYADGTSVKDGECYALVWVKTGTFFGGFNADGTAADSDNNAVLQISACAKDGKCDGVLFHVAADQDAAYAGAGAYQVYLMDTRDAAGVPSAVVGGKVERVNACGLCPDAKAVVSESAPRRVMATLSAAGVEAGVKFVTTGNAYADGARVLNGESYVLVKVEDGKSFEGFDWNLPQQLTTDGFPRVLTTAVNGGADVDLSELPSLEDGWHYEVILVDSRGADGALVKETVAGGAKWISGWCAFAVQEGQESLIQTPWHRVEIGASGVFDVNAQQQCYFEQDPSPFVASGYAAIYDLLKLGFWTVFPLPKAYTKVLDETQSLTWNKNYTHLNKDVPPFETSFDLDVAYSFNAFANDTERDIVLKALEGVDFTKMGNPGSPAYAATLQFHEKVLAGTFFEDPDWSSSNEVLRAWYVRTMPYLQWNADFEVSFDRTVKAGSVVLAGAYEQAKDWEGDTGYNFSNWVGDSPRADITVGTKYRLLASNDTAQVTLNYQEVCKRVQEFLCGVHNFKSENWGTTMRVDLKLYENTGCCNERAGGVQATVGTYKYTFKGPLYVNFNKGGNEPVGAVMPDNLETNTDGRAGFPLSVPAYDHDANKDITFVGWSNAVVKALWTEIPTNTWATKDAPIELYAVWKEATATKVTVKPAEGTQQAVTSDIKVTKEWLEEKIGEGASEKTPEEVQNVLEQPVANEKSDLTYWQAYLLGIDPKDPNAELKVEKTNGKEDDKALVVSTVQVVAPDAGIKVGYSLDKVGSDEKPIEGKKGEEQPTKDLKIDLAPADGDTPTGYYKMNVIFTPTENGVEGDKVTIPADNTIGVLKVETDEKLVPVAVPWKSLNSGDRITVDEVLKTSTLSDGDQLHVYDKANKVYNNWELKDGEWTPVKSYALDENGKVTEKEVVGPATQELNQGDGILLERKDTGKPFYLIGSYDSNATPTSEVKAPAAEAQRPEYNLIASTGIEDIDLNEVPALQSAAESKKDDKIVLMRNGITTRLSPTADNKWGYKKTVFAEENGKTVRKLVTVTNDSTVQAGLGIWYISNDKGGEDINIEWTK